MIRYFQFKTGCVSVILKKEVSTHLLIVLIQQVNCILIES